jgi:hypothetical protein
MFIIAIMFQLRTLIPALLGIKDKVKEIEWLIMALYKKFFGKV